ncbi:uncharacterized protein LOC105842576 [Bombyx mori]|uniref:Uncharacterized protein n=1 Tax=Bombyx mori TaxID=7091 RepID=A0A8R2GD47_BOMMO|nr:uncharacterized protein LOC105842576 [Bombyx mori]
MESQRAAARGRGRGGRGGIRSVRGGSHHQAQPSASELPVTMPIQELPPGQSLETPLHPKRVRVLAAVVAKHPRSEMWRTDVPSPTRRDQELPVPSPALQRRRRGRKMLCSRRWCPDLPGCG